MCSFLGMLSFRKLLLHSFFHARLAYKETTVRSLIRLRSISLDGTVAAVGRLVFAEGHFEYKKRHTEIDSATVR